MSKKAPKSKYASVSGATVSRRANYIRPGRYLVRVDRFEEGQNRKKQDFVVSQMTVVNVSETAVPGRDYDRDRDLPLHSVGEEISDLMMVANIAFEQRVKGFVMAAGDLTQEDFDEEEYEGALIDAAVAEDQPLAGYTVEVLAEQIVKQGASEPYSNDDVYTRCTYIRRVPASELAEHLGEKDLTRFYPDLDEKIAAEAEEAAED